MPQLFSFLLLLSSRVVNTLRTVESQACRLTSSVATTRCTTPARPGSLRQLSWSCSLCSNQSVMALGPPGVLERTLPVDGLILGCVLKKGGNALLSSSRIIVLRHAASESRRVQMSAAAVELAVERFSSRLRSHPWQLTCRRAVESILATKLA